MSEKEGWYPGKFAGRLRFTEKGLNRILKQELPITKEELKSFLKAQLEDEKKAYDAYLTHSVMAEKLGQPIIVEALHNIAKDEQKHYEIISLLLQRFQ